MSVATTRPSAGPSGVVTVATTVCTERRRLGGQQQADSSGGATERRRSGADVAQFHQGVVRQGMVDHVKRHAVQIRTKIGLCAPGSPPWPPSLSVAMVACLPRMRRARVVLIVTGGTVVTVDAAGRVHRERRRRHRWHRHRGGRYRRRDRQAVSRTRDDRCRRPGRDAGLVNTHTHAPMVLYRGLADDLPLMEWLNKYIFPAEAKTVSPEFVRAGTRLAALEMIESGTTTFADMYYFEEEIAKRRKAAGLRGVLGQTIIQLPGGRRQDAGGRSGPRRSVHQRVQGRSADHAGRRAACDLHAGRPDAQARRAICRGATSVPTLIHLAETRDEDADVRRSVVQVVTGCISRRPRLPRPGRARGARCLGVGRRHRHAEDAGRRRLAQPREQHEAGERRRRRSPATCAPACRSVSAPTARPATTTSTCSRRCAWRRCSQQAADASIPRAAQRARRCWRWPPSGRPCARHGRDRIGSLEAGKRADLIVVRCDGGPADADVRPDLAARLHDARRRRADTVVHGNVLMRDRKVLTLDEAAVLKEARSWAEKVSAAVADTAARRGRAVASYVPTTAMYGRLR